MRLKGDVLVKLKAVFHQKKKTYIYCKCLHEGTLFLLLILFHNWPLHPLALLEDCCAVVLLCRPPKVEMRLRGREMRLWKFELCFQQPLLRTTLGDDHLKAQAHCVPLHRDSASAERERYWQSFSEESEHVFFYCVVSTDVVVFLLAVKLISIHQRIAVLFHDGNGNSPT